MTNQIICGDNIKIVSSWKPNSIDGIVTDPPYGIGFMGKTWDTYSDKSLGHYHTNHSFAGNKRPKEKSAFTTRATAAGSYDFSLQGQNNFYNWMLIWAKAMLSVTKPGGFLLCFGGTRTFHRLTCAIEDAGWEIRDCMMWLYGQGFPKSHNISKAIDKAAGAKRKVIGERTLKGNAAVSCKEKGGTYVAGAIRVTSNVGFDVTVPATDFAQLWDGYGTALKPAWEPIIVAMKPLDGTFAHNAKRHGVAGLNIDAGRIKTNEKLTFKFTEKMGSGDTFKMAESTDKKRAGTTWENTQGRWPANLLLTHHPDCQAGDNGRISCHPDCPVRILDEQSGTLQSGKMEKYHNIGKADGFLHNYGIYGERKGIPSEIYGDSGGASRFFYCAKCSKKERNMGLDDQSGKKVNDGRQTPIDNPYQRGETIRRNTHPTVKPLALMKYLCNLLKMPSAEQIILDPFMGSGTTGMACASLGIGFIGIEKEPDYCEIAAKRIAAISGTTLPVISHTKMLRAGERFVGDKLENVNPVQATTTSPNKNPPRNDEHRQSIIDAAAAALRGNRK